MEDDRISKLPDEILGHIISFLPSEDAFTTRLLSKGWKPLWLLCPSPNLDFDDLRFFKKEEPYISFKDMVNLTIIERSEHQPIKSFRLRCHESHDSFMGEFSSMLLLMAIERRMEYIDIHMSDTWKFNINCFIFRFSNLVVLKLKFVCLDLFLSANLPSLKILHLNSVHFFEHGFILDILNSCPILEDLEMKDLSTGYWSHDYDDEEVKMLTNLVRANVSNLSIYDVDMKVFSNVEFLRLEKMYGGVPVFTNLTHLEIFFGILIRWTFVFYILDSCPKLQDFLLDMPLTPNIYNLEIFPNILTQRLSLDLKSCTITNYRGEKDELRFVQLMLLNSISLESMRLHCLPSLNSQEKLEMQIELLSFPRSSVKCVVYVE
ncbi:unnamed protein product [Vicia faba]|uniref:F-box domain-containing protein n=1 Tax=Vicia faba TaxID=3906 RepID=A0AAV1AS34_VICFA|nr:unnamed protein product [Vicia faba]